jgi:hypothetical protein
MALTEVVDLEVEEVSEVGLATPYMEILVR